MYFFLLISKLQQQRLLAFRIEKIICTVDITFYIMFRKRKQAGTVLYYSTISIHMWVVKVKWYNLVDFKNLNIFSMFPGAQCFMEEIGYFEVFSDFAIFLHFIL